MSTIFNGFDYLQQLALLRKYSSDPQRRLLYISSLAAALGAPQSHLNIIHVAGSKGKGSTSAFVAASLQHLGYKTALFTSPHVYDVRERLLINGQKLDSHYWHTSLEQIKRAAEDHKTSTDVAVTYFEALTLMAFMLSKELKVDYLVLETGLGGRFDATNIADPLVTVITPIELEHTEILGDTLKKIAFEKAGIIKQHKPLFCAEQKEEVLAVLRAEASNQKASFTYLPDEVNSIEALIKPDHFLMQGSFMLNDRKISASYAMIGHQQVANSALALLTLKTLFPGEETRLMNAWQRAVHEVRLFCRFEIREHKPLVVLDGAHTVESLSLAVTNFTIMTESPRAVIFSCAPDKDLVAMLPLLASFDTIIVSATEQNRKVSEQQYEQVKARYPFARYEPAAGLALKKVKAAGLPVLVTGSFYLAQELDL